MDGGQEPHLVVLWPVESIRGPEDASHEHRAHRLRARQNGWQDLHRRHANAGRRLFIHLAQGGSIHTFIKDHDWLKPEQLKAVLQFAADDMVNDRGAVGRARAAAGLAENPHHSSAV